MVSHRFSHCKALNYNFKVQFFFVSIMQNHEYQMFKQWKYCLTILLIFFWMLKLKKHCYIGMFVMRKSAAPRLVIKVWSPNPLPSCCFNGISPHLQVLWISMKWLQSVDGFWHQKIAWKVSGLNPLTTVWFCYNTHFP